MALAHPITGSKVVLTVAHLDHTPENVDLENLVHLCQSAAIIPTMRHTAPTHAKPASGGRWSTSRAAYSDEPPASPQKEDQGESYHKVRALRI